ncbi:MAG: hypothetical protein ACXAB9_11880 [Candidatus Thorarchaeota archaeon]|jgi:hypothetical protein
MAAKFNPTPTRYVEHLKRWNKDDTTNKQIKIYFPGVEAMKILSDIDKARQQITENSERRVRLGRSDFIRQALRYALDNMKEFP